MTSHGLPKVIVTERDIALMNTIRIVFLKSSSLFPHSKKMLEPSGKCWLVLWRHERLSWMHGKKLWIVETILLFLIIMLGDFIMFVMFDLYFLNMLMNHG